MARVSPTWKTISFLRRLALPHRQNFMWLITYPTPLAAPLSQQTLELITPILTQNFLQQMLEMIRLAYFNRCIKTRVLKLT